MTPSLLLVLALLATACQADDVIIKPSKKWVEDVALVIIQGAQIPADRYIPLAQYIQNQTLFKYSTVWVGIPEFSLSIPEPLVISGGISRVVTAMKTQGMNKTAKLFIAGHSLGGIILQDYLKSTPSLAEGQILMGSFLQRKYRNTTFPVATLTIGGELDGLCHVTRIMEEYYHRVLPFPPQNLETYTTFPVAVIPGLSHIQFASGDPPKLVKLRDLRPEISNENAHTILGLLIVSFIELKLRGPGDKVALYGVASYVIKSYDFLSMIIKAYELEGSYRFLPPCYQGLGGKCTLGSPWSQYAQEIMGGLPEGKVNDTDVFHPVYQINPVHLPHVLNTTNCSVPSKFCTVNMTTVSQNVYDEFDNLIDAGFVPTSASEIRVKLKSRQVVMEAGGHKNMDFNKTDGFSICKIINEHALNWTLVNINRHALDRFNKYGVPMVMGEDKGPYNVGPIWIWDPLSYTKTKTSDGKEVIEVRSVTMRTPKDYPIKAAAGMHYCKLLSPARAMEWMLVDGLREHYGINN